MNKSNHRDLVRLPLDVSREHLMVYPARMASGQSKTLKEIASETGMNRWRVSKLLQDALDVGIVTGSATHHAVLGALRAGYLNALITDQDTAEFALESANDC